MSNTEKPGIGLQSADWWKSHPVAVGGSIAIMLGGVVLLAVLGWGWLRASEPGSESNSATFRNIGLLVAALVSGLLVAWRNIVASQQAKAAQQHAESAEEQARATLAQAESAREQARATLAQAESVREQAREQARALRTQTEAAQAQIDVARAEARDAERRATESRFERGAESLSSEQIVVRISGVEALRQMSLDLQEPYLSRIVQVLCTFARHSVGQVASIQDAPEDRVRAVVAASAAFQRIAALGTETDAMLEFSETNLRGADLARVNFSCGYFSRAHLDRAILENAILTDVYLDEANLTRTHLLGANLTSALLGSSIAYMANFRRTDLTNARLDYVGLAGADLTDANLTGTDLTAARFVPSFEEYEDLVEFLDMETYSAPHDIVARGLTQKQLDSAVAEPGSPPSLHGLRDARTGKSLIWRDDPMRRPTKLD